MLCIATPLIASPRPQRNPAMILGRRRSITTCLTVGSKESPFPISTFQTVLYTSWAVIG